MSKAFTREDGALPEPPVIFEKASTLPAGAKNYITPRGAQRLREELQRLIEVERPRIVAAREEIEAKQQLQLLDRRIDELQESLQSAVIVSPPAGSQDRVRFGASVIVRGPSGDESVYRIVGVDETDIDRGWVSWLSPIARALLNARTGEYVRFKFPSGEEELEIVSIAYE